MTTTPTPRPWFTTPDYPLSIMAADEPGHEPWHVANVMPDCGSAEEADVNTALIVRAVNSHDALIAALEGLLSIGHDDADDMLVQNAVTVLKQAREG